MPVIFKCGCGKYLSASRKLIGKKIRCRACGEVRSVPDPTQKRKDEESKPRRLATGELEASGFHRLKKAADLGEDVVLEKHEVEGLALSSSGDAPPAKPDRGQEKPRKPDVAARKTEPKRAEKAVGAIDITCFCGRAYSLPKEKAGTTFACESCGRMIAIPGGKSAAKLELVPEEEGEPCLNCGALLPADARVCRSCGTKIDPRFQSKRVSGQPGETTKARLRKKRKR